MKHINKNIIAGNIAEMASFGTRNRARFYNALMKCRYAKVVELYRMMFHSDKLGIGLYDMATIIGCLMCNILVSADYILPNARFTFRSNGVNTCEYKGQTIQLPC